jgi:hypothetical protein
MEETMGGGGSLQAGNINVKTFFRLFILELTTSNFQNNIKNFHHDSPCLTTESCANCAVWCFFNSMDAKDI